MTARRDDAPMFLAGAAAVCTVVSIAAFEIAMGAAALALILTRARWRTPPVLLPLGLFIGATIASLAAHSSLHLGYPQLKKFFVYLMLFLVVSAFYRTRDLRWVAWGWAAAAALSALWAMNQFY